MVKKLDRTKDFRELHVEEDVKKGLKGGIFLIQGRKAYNFDGTPVEPGKIWICPHCECKPGQFPFMNCNEREFAKHMVEKHPEQAKPKPKDPRPKTAKKKKG